MSKKREANLYYMTMFPFSRSILLMGIWARYVMCDAYLAEKGIELLILASPIGLYGDDSSIKETFNKALKFTELLKDFRFKFEHVDPSVFAIVVNKTNIVLFASCGNSSRTPNIRVNKFKRMRRHTLRSRIR